MLNPGIHDTLLVYYVFITIPILTMVSGVYLFYDFVEIQVDHKSKMILDTEEAILSLTKAHKQIQTE